MIYNFPKRSGCPKCGNDIRHTNGKKHIIYYCLGCGSTFIPCGLNPINEEELMLKEIKKEEDL